MPTPKNTTTNIKSAAPWKAAGLTVTVTKLACSPRCAAETPDTPRARQILDDYESGRLLDIPPKLIMQAYQSLLSECKMLQVGRLTGAAA